MGQIKNIKLHIVTDIKMEINKINNFVCVSYGEKGTRRYRIIEEDGADDISEIDVNARYKWSWSWLEGSIFVDPYNSLNDTSWKKGPITIHAHTHIKKTAEDGCA